MMKKKFIFALAIVIAVLEIWLVFISGTQQKMTIHFLDVGQGDATIVQCGDKVMVIDGGGSGESSLLYSYLTNTLGVEHVDYIVATHPHADHIGGLSGVLNACTVGRIYSPVLSFDSEQFISLSKYVQKQGCEIVLPKAGDMISFGDAQIQFLSPMQQYADNVNNYSIVIRIIHGKNTFLFAGDAEWDAEHDMVNSGYDLSSTVLKVGHHGSDTSSSYVFLRDVMPRYAVISCGKDNSYEHPSGNVLSRLRDVGAAVYRTDLHGDITCISDGQLLLFLAEKSVDPYSVLQNVDDRVSEQKTVLESGTEYIGNIKTRKFHDITCLSVKEMKEANKERLSTREEAIKNGYIPCKRCNP